MSVELCRQCKRMVKGIVSFKVSGVRLEACLDCARIAKDRFKEAIRIETERTTDYGAL